MYLAASNLFEHTAPSSYTPYSFFSLTLNRRNCGIFFVRIRQAFFVWPNALVFSTKSRWYEHFTLEITKQVWFVCVSVHSIDSVYRLKSTRRGWFFRLYFCCWWHRRYMCVCSQSKSLAKWKCNVPFYSTHCYLQQIFIYSVFRYYLSVGFNNNVMIVHMNCCTSRLLLWML